MSIPPNSNFDEIQKWLNKKLSQEQSIKACCEEATKVPTSKGIYFWFMKKEGYKELSKIETIKPDKDAISKKINGTECDLVYLGTAGARNNSSGTNSGNLQERLKWHLCNNKNISSLCNGTMSTYRRTLGALLASDLIDNDLQTKLDNFLCKYFYIYYIEYPGTFKDVKNIIEKDEDILISVLRPIFNLSKNPNKENPQHTTHFIQQRRQLVERNSKEKHCNQKGSGKNVKLPLLTTKKVISAKSQEKESCVEFQVKRSENIAEVATRIRNLPNGPCSIELFSDNRIDIRLYVNGNTRLIRKNGRSVSEYFAAPDTNNGNLPKWQMVYNEMNDKKKPIESITVRICRIENNSKNESYQKKIPIKKPVTTLTSNFISDLIKQNPNITDKTQKKLLIIGCCDAKSYQPNNLNNANYINYDFGALLDITRQQRMLDYMNMPANHFQGKKRNNALVNQAYFMGAINQNNRRDVFSVYGNNNSKFFNPNIKALYINKIQNSNLQILIISGLYGLLHHSDYINDYHLKIKPGNNIWENTIANSINDFINHNSIENKNVFYCLSSDYRPFIGIPNIQWQNLWCEYGLQGAQGKKNANDLITFLNKM